MFKRFITCLLTLTFVITMTVQVVPHAPAASMPTSMAGMDMSDCDQQTPPCKGTVPTCLDNICCAMIVGVLGAPVLASVPFSWIVSSYTAADVALSGRTIRPELFPPILRA